MSISRTIARPMLASTFVLGGFNALRNAKALAPAAKPVTEKVVPVAQKVAPTAPLPRDPETLVRVNAIAQIGAGLALATGRAPRLSATVLAATLVPTTVAGHAFWEESESGSRQGQLIHFSKNLSMLGGLLLAAVDTDGKPGLGWRARRAAADVRRESKRLAHEAKREAKLAKATLT